MTAFDEIVVIRTGKAALELYVTIMRRVITMTIRTRLMRLTIIRKIIVIAIIIGTIRILKAIIPTIVTIILAILFFL